MKRKTTTLLSALLLSGFLSGLQAQTLLKDLNPGPAPASSNPQQFTDVNGTMFFLTIAGSNRKHQIWKSDGTTENTVLVKDSVVIANLGDVVKFQTGLNGFLYYTFSTSPAVSTQLWKTDGVTTTLVKTLNYQSGKGIAPKNFIAFKDKLYFQMAIDHGLELWVTDGTEAGTMEVINLDPGTSGSTQLNGVAGSNMIVYKDKLYFSGETTPANYELFATDGTAGGTALVKDLYNGTIDGGNPGNWLILNNELFFTAKTSNSGSSLWKTDGTNVTQVTTSLDTKNPVLFKNQIFFSSGIDLWKSDGTVSGTSLVASGVTSGGYNGANSNYLFTSYAKFKTTYPYYDYFYYKTDGSTATAITQEEFNKSSFIVLNNNMYQLLLDAGSTTSTSIWQYDGNTSIKIVDGGYNGVPFVYKRKLYFAKNETATANELWVYDPSSVVTSVNETVPETNSLNISPNPSEGIFAIRTGSNGFNTDFTVNTITGEKILEGSNASEINLSGYPKGVYFANLKNGIPVQTKKIIVN